MSPAGDNLATFARSPREPEFTNDLGMILLALLQLLNNRVRESQTEAFQRRGLRFSRNGRAVEVIKLFIDLYHTAAILSPRRTKSFVFARLASHWMRG